MEGSERRYVDNTSQFPSAGLTIRQKEPKNLEAPFDQIDSYLTPTELFYIRSHFSTPALDRASYQLRIDGAVRRPFAVSYDELRSMPSETRVATLECAGNSRVFLVPQVQGAQWELGAVSNAEWTGVSSAISCFSLHLIAAGMQVLAVICRGPGSFIGSISLRFPGEHAAIIERQNYDQVQQLLASKPAGRKARRTASEALLMGKLYDDRGNRMSPSFSPKAACTTGSTSAQRCCGEGRPTLGPSGVSLRPRLRARSLPPSKHINNKDNPTMRPLPLETSSALSSPAITS
jgi:Oxidoreductase molybdopterin binding domain